MEPEVLAELPAEVDDTQLPDESVDTLADGPTGPFEDPRRDESLSTSDDERVSTEPASAPEVPATPPIGAPVTQVLPNVSRAALDRIQGGRVPSASSQGVQGPSLAAEALAEPPPVTELGEGPQAGLASEERQPGSESNPRAARDLSPPPTDSATTASDRAVDPTRGGDRRSSTAEPAPAARPAPERPLPPERAADVLRQVRVQLTPGLREVTVRLQPATLGRVAIRIALREGRATTEVRAERASTLEALERHLPELRAALEQQGIDAGEFDLGLGFEDGPSFEDDFAPAGFRTHTAHVASPLGRDARTPPNSSNVGDSGVDTYA